MPRCTNSQKGKSCTIPIPADSLIAWPARRRRGLCFCRSTFVIFVSLRQRFNSSSCLFPYPGIYFSVVSKYYFDSCAWLCTCGRCTSRYCFMVEHNGPSAAATPYIPQSATRRPSPAAALHGDRRTTRKIASKACQYCRARKVRCNVTQDGMPCTNCRLDDFKCVVREGGRRADATREYTTPPMTRSILQRKGRGSGSP
jgi:hypothetical protein